MKRRNLILLLGGASSGAMSVGTGAFSSMEAERGVSVNVASDDEAFVGYQSDARALPDDLNGDETIDLVTVENRFAQNIEFVDAVLDEGDEHFDEPNIPDGEIEPGDTATVTAKPKPTIASGDTPIWVAVTIHVKGTGVSAELFGDTETRRFPVGTGDPAVTYQGRGSVNVESQTGSSDNIEIDVYSIPNGDPTKQDKRDSLSSPDTVEIQPNTNENLSGWIVAVEVDGEIYQHPSWDESNCAFDGFSGGLSVPVDDPPSCE